MIIIISPAKTIDFSLPFDSNERTNPAFKKEADLLAAELQQYTTFELKELMHISDSLALLNYERYQEWKKRSTPKKQALSVFKGEVYNGMQAWQWSEDTIKYAQNHLRILSGIYGILRPLDEIKAYRLEMGTKLEDKTLYQFWGDSITKNLNRLAPKNNRILINLASKEYSKVVDFKNFKGTVITPDFKEMHKGDYKTIAIFAKKARGLMSRFILENKIENPEEIKAFNIEGYEFNHHLSTETNYVFTRG